MSEQPQRLIDAVHGMAATIRATTNSLEMAAYSLRQVGLDRPAERIEWAIGALDNSAEKLLAAYNADLNHHVAHSEAMMGHLLKATLEGCIVSPKQKAPSHD